MKNHHHPSSVLQRATEYLTTFTMTNKLPPFGLTFHIPFDWPGIFALLPGVS